MSRVGGPFVYAHASGVFFADSVQLRATAAMSPARDGRYDDANT